MAVYCPNRNRGKRTVPPLNEGGRANCRGRLVVAMRVPMLLPLKSARDEAPDTMLARYVLRYGVRVTPAALVEALRHSDVRCSDCSYSRRALLAKTKTRANRDGSIRRG